MFLNTIKTTISISIRKILFRLVCLIPKQKNLVLFSAWFGEKYIDSTKYLYEYFLTDSAYEVYWITKSSSIYEQLKNKKYPVAYASSFKAKLLLIRAQVCFSTVQFSDFNCWYLGNCFYIDLGHGNMIKDPGSILHDKESRNVQNYLLKYMHYYAIVPSTYAKHYYKQVVELDDSNIIVSDFARNDVFIDSKLREGKNQLLQEYYNRRIIVYMPTHRSDGKKSLKLEDVLPLKEIDGLCENTKSIFVIKKHFYHRNEKLDLSQYNNIIDITNVEDIDPQVLLYQADVLITDYSSCFIDYLLLCRPIVFFQFDFDYYIKEERSLFIDFEKENFAPVVKDKNELVSVIRRVIEYGNSNYKDNLNRITKIFFDNPVQTGGRKKDKEIMELLLQKTGNKR